MTYINFKLYLHAKARPINYTHEVTDCHQAHIVTEIIAAGYDFEIWFLNSALPLLTVSREGHEVAAWSLADVDVDSLNATLPALLDHVHHIVHPDYVTPAQDAELHDGFPPFDGENA